MTWIPFCDGWQWPSFLKCWRPMYTINRFLYGSINRVDTFNAAVAEWRMQGQECSMARRVHVIRGWTWGHVERVQGFKEALATPSSRRPRSCPGHAARAHLCVRLILLPEVCSHQLRFYINDTLIVWFPPGTDLAATVKWSRISCLCPSFPIYAIFTYFTFFLLYGQVNVHGQKAIISDC